MSAAGQIAQSAKKCLPSEAVHIGPIPAQNLTSRRTAASPSIRKIGRFFGAILCGRGGPLLSPGPRPRGTKDVRLADRGDGAGIDATPTGSCGDQVSPASLASRGFSHRLIRFFLAPEERSPRIASEPADYCGKRQRLGGSRCANFCSAYFYPPRFSRYSGGLSRNGRWRRYGRHDHANPWLGALRRSYAGADAGARLGRYRNRDGALLLLQSAWLQRRRVSPRRPDCRQQWQPLWHDIWRRRGGNRRGVQARAGRDLCGAALLHKRQRRGLSRSRPVRRSSGNLYGTTEFGGGSGCSLGCGTVFKLTGTGFVTGPPTAVNETASTTAGKPVMLDLSAGASGTPTSAAIVSGPTNGMISASSGTKVA